MPNLPVRFPGRVPSRVAHRLSAPARLVAPPQALLALAALIRDRIAERLVERVVRRPSPAASAPHEPDAVVVSAAAPFAPSAYARARLLRQMHACGLLSERETEQAQQILGVAN